jgi:hypothetical protein
MPEEDQYDRDMYNILTKLTKYVKVESTTYVSFNMVYHKGKFPEKKVFSYGAHEAEL